MVSNGGRAHWYDIRRIGKEMNIAAGSRQWMHRTLAVSLSFDPYRVNASPAVRSHAWIDMRADYVAEIGGDEEVLVVIFGKVTQLES